MQTTAKYDEKYLKENKIQLLQEPGNCSELSKAVIFHTVREYEVTWQDTWVPRNTCGWRIDGPVLGRVFAEPHRLVTVET